MLLTEIFSNPFKASPEKLLAKAEALLGEFKSHLHLAHTRQHHSDKQEAYNAALKSFGVLKARHEAGEDVTEQVKDFIKSLKPAANNI